ncbi:MAG: single-stranded-DNA-specific exonuclease RecJ [Desulfuromonadales bacterium]|nr:single-stranded-DNA-specific exonuclease RecJ [Desulfuromonadales bacterium]
MDPVTARRWMARCDDLDLELVRQFSEQLEIPSLMARLLVGRDYTLESAAPFLAANLADLPDPFTLPDMDIAVARLQQAIVAGEKTAIHGDYDVDGISGAALLVAGLEAFGAKKPEYHIPLRLRDGYGLSAQALQDAAEAEIAVVVSVDCGVTAHAEAELAQQLGIDLIITDHHQVPNPLPKAFAVINPQRDDSAFAFKDLSGVGVAFFLLIALRKQLRDDNWFDEQRPEPDLRRFLDLVALGTIADLVPLQGVNRTFARHGMRLMDAAPRLGVRALKQVAGVDEVSSSAVGYQLAPRLNAAGRMEDASLGVELLLEQDNLRAMNTARFLDKCNHERRDTEKEALVEADAAAAALGDDHSHSIVLAQQGWHPGVIGIVASRLVDRYYRPTVLIALDGENGKGSCRSVRGFHLYRGLQACAEHLSAFGGHEMAAGLSLEQSQLSDFSAAFEAYARQELSADDLIPKLRYDGAFLLQELDLETLRQMQQLAPHGMGNPEPLLLLESVRAMTIKELKGGHLRFTACQDGYSHPAIAFGMQARREEFNGEVDLLVTPQINRYMGRESVQLKVKDVRPASNQ